MEKVSSLINYLIGLFLMWFGRHTPQDIAFMVGSGVAVVTLVTNVATFFINWHYRRKTFELQRRSAQGVNLEPDR
ncbi:HP1 family phage holin [Duffyella gerundensis]|uniref:HP1 family phage holin n=1 Tax=Duffyella gerundensis TaxID=1619313 RepID=UPI001654A6FD|nr:HP1 family phage holin [Duffyella gerundensis]